MTLRSLLPLILAAGLGLTACVASGGSDTPVAAAKDSRLETLGKLVEQRLGRNTEDGSSVHVVSVRPLGVLGLYEVVTEDHKLVYTDEKADYVMTGHIYDLKSMQDLTADRLEQISAIKPETLPLDLAIKTVKGNGKRLMVVFSDTDCPYCRKLETEMNNVTDVTVYTFLFPIEQLHPNAPEHSRRIWCAQDRLKAWNDYWNHNTLPEPRQCDASALDTILKLGRKNGIQATPTLIFADGRVIPGAMPTAQLEKALGPR